MHLVIGSIIPLKLSDEPPIESANPMKLRTSKFYLRWSPSILSMNLLLVDTNAIGANHKAQEQEACNQDGTLFKITVQLPSY